MKYKIFIKMGGNYMDLGLSYQDVSSISIGFFGNDKNGFLNSDRKGQMFFASEAEPTNFIPYAEFEKLL